MKTLVKFCFLLCFLCLSAYSQVNENKLSLIMTGDALLHSRVYEDAKFKDKNSKTGYSYDFSKALIHLKDIISKYDLAFYNQESILGGKELGLSSYPNFNSPQEFGDEMINIGFNLVSLANNHSLDRGEKAILSSLSYWKSKPNVLTSGTYASFKERDEIQIKEKNGIKYAFLAYTYGVNNHRIPKAYLVDLIDKDKIAKDIQKIRPQVDLVLVSLHWGNEYVFEPNKEQKDLAHFLAQQGVDIIIGTHSHYVAPIEFIDNTLVIYSLGNFISSQIGLNRRVGMLVGVDVEKKGTKINLNNVEVELIYTYYNDDFKNFAVYPFSKLNDKLLPNYHKIEEQFKKIIFKNKTL